MLGWTSYSARCIQFVNHLERYLFVKKTADTFVNIKPKQWVVLATVHWEGFSFCFSLKALLWCRAAGTLLTVVG